MHVATRGIRKNMLEARHRSWIAALTSTDIDAYAAMVTDDLVWLPPGTEAIVGRHAFRAWLAPFFKMYAYESTIRDVKAYESGDWIAETGVFNSRMTPRDGGPSGSHSSRYFVMWQRQDGEWKINRYIDRSNL
jgi:uncharacterized protein (TIGR02246 family)